MRWSAAMGLAVLWPACSGDGGTDTGKSDTDSGLEADTDTDADADTDTDTDTDTDAEPPMGLVVRVGQATAIPDVSYTGTETLEFRTGDYYEVPRCQITYDVTSTAVGDCDTCYPTYDKKLWDQVWSFELVTSNATIVTDDPTCLSGLGFDASNVSSLDGQVLGYGYNPDYVGHAQLLFVETAGVWGPATYAQYNPATGAFIYEWEDGVVAY